jgi:hypothetical protein
VTLVGDLDAADLRRRLARDGLAIATGMYGVRMRSDVPLVAEAIGDHYAHHRLLDEDAIIDRLSPASSGRSIHCEHFRRRPCRTRCP